MPSRTTIFFSCFYLLPIQCVVLNTPLDIEIRIFQMLNFFLTINSRLYHLGALQPPPPKFYKVKNISYSRFLKFFKFFQSNLDYNLIWQNVYYFCFFCSGCCLPLIFFYVLPFRPLKLNSQKKTLTPLEQIPNTEE